MTTLSDRQNKYEESSNFTVLPGVPVIVRSEIRNFSRLVRDLKKPFCYELWRIMREAMLTTVMEIDSVVISYHHNSEMNFILHDKDNPYFYSNDIQKIATTISSLCSINFMKHFLSSDDPPDILGEAVFETTVSAVPNELEAMEYLLWRQQIAVSNSVNSALEYEMLKINDDKRDVTLSLSRKSVSEKKNMLYDECNIDFEDYPKFFRLGSICYKAPKIFNEETVKKKWMLDLDMPDIIDNKSFILNIINTGQDVMRPERDIVY